MKTKSSIRRAYAYLAAVAIIVNVFVFVPARLIARQDTPKQAAAPQQAATPAEKTAGDRFMNVTVLKDIPAAQLVPAMKYITTALGVRCEFCHDEDHFDSDDKPEKLRARNMMKMMLAINEENFNGRRMVTCYTCHRGVAKAASTPVILASPASASNPPAAKPSGAAENPASAPSVPLPTIDQVLDKYVEALGGADAVQKITSLVEKGAFEMPSRNFHVPIEVYRAVPPKVLTVMKLPDGELLQGFDGTIAWQQQAGGEANEQKGDELIKEKEWAALYPGLQFKQNHSRTQVTGVEKIGDHDATVLAGLRTGGGEERFYFDTQTGLLLRTSAMIESFLGALPEDTNYENYRQVGSTKFPFTIQIVHVDNTMVYTWEKVEINVPVNDARFQKPAEKSGDQPAKQ